jgi:predicted nucleotidyltransferase
VLASRYGSRLKAVYLFGSRARGDYRPDSDADVAIFVDLPGQTRAELLRDQVNLSGEAYDIWLETDIRIQPWIFSSDALVHPERDRNAHLLRRILNEGVTA